MKPTKDEIITNLELLSKESGFIYSLSLLLVHDLFFDPANIADINWHERLSFQEYSFLLGLMVKSRIDLSFIPTEDIYMSQIARLNNLFKSLHNAYNEPLMKDLVNTIKHNNDKETLPNNRASDIFKSGEFMTEPIFYGDSGAYDFQYLEFAIDRYKKDKEWLINNKGFCIEDLTVIFNSIKIRSEIKAIMETKENCFLDSCKNAFAIFTFTFNDLNSIEQPVFNSFINSFSVIPGRVNENYSSPGAYNRIDSHPIILLGSDCYFLPITFNLARSIYESPFYWMSSDPQYKDVAFSNRGEATEYFAYKMLSSVFGSASVFHGVNIVLPNGNSITDIDVLAVCGNKAIIVQAKSKKLTQLARSGNEEQLKKDFNDAVQSAYEQGIKCRNEIFVRSNVLIDRNNNKVPLDEWIDEAYIICLTADHYPALSHQVDSYLIKDSIDPFPLALSIFDLEIISFYLKDPFEFLYYLRQRISNADHFKAGNEMVYLAFHLNNKLYPDKKATIELLEDSYAQLIDANYPAMKGYHPMTDAITKLHHKWKNDKFDLLVQQVKRTKHPGFTDAIFYLYDLAGDGADTLIETIEQQKNDTIHSGKNHNLSMVFDNGKSGVTFLIQKNQIGIESRLMQLCMARKYKTKADMWLGFASFLGSSNYIDFVVFNKQSWSYDIDLETLSNTLLKKGTYVIPGQLPGRNDPCPCGSGIKFKKCCGSN